MQGKSHHVAIPKKPTWDSFCFFHFFWNRDWFEIDGQVKTCCHGDEIIILKFFSRNLFQKIEKVLNPIIRKANQQVSSWFLQKREEIVVMCKNDGFHANEMMFEAYLGKLMDLIRNEEFFVKSDLTNLLCNQLWFFWVVRRYEYTHLRN